MPRIAKCMIALAVLAPLSGCSKTIAAIANAEQLCKDWRHQTVSKDDKLTDGTASGIEGNNEARKNWDCEPGENRAKS